MPQSLSQVIVHLVYSTKGRNPWIAKDFEPRLHAYLSRVLAHEGHISIIVGGHLDHIHLLFGISRTATIASVASLTKTASSKWIKQEFGIENFGWQHGYGAFSVSPKDEASVIAYIANQETRHAKLSFQEELRLLLKESSIDFDERYLWD